VPIYDYVCSNCGHQMEVSHSIHAPGPSECPNCGGPMKKAISAPAVHFKGTGWARKDRSAGSKPARAKEPESSSGSGSTASGDSGSTASSKSDTSAS
jgi:putative FmdB family regulatory protein